MNCYILPIVEGETERHCIERLLHRAWSEVLSCADRLQVLRAFVAKRGALVHLDGKILSETVQKAFLELQAKRRKDPDARLLLLILLDAEKECPAIIAPRLLETARKSRSDATIACVMAKRMLENWIVAGASALGGVNGLPDPLPPRDQFEDRSGVFWLEQQLRSKNSAKKYRKTLDASVFFKSVDLAECRQNAPSFDKLCRDLEGWIK